MKLEELDFDVIDWNEDEEIEENVADESGAVTENIEEGSSEEEVILSSQTLVIPPPDAVASAMEADDDISAIAALAAELEDESDESLMVSPEVPEEVYEEEEVSLVDAEEPVPVVVAPKKTKATPENGETKKAKTVSKNGATAKTVATVQKTKPTVVKTKSKPVDAPVKAKKTPKKDDSDDKKGGFHLSAIDMVIAFVGVLVVLMLVVVIVFWRDNKNTMIDIGEFATVGAQLSDLKTIGRNGINRVVSAASSDIEAENVVTTADGEEVFISVQFTSLEKDLKIKFINQYTEKILAGVPFSIEAVAPNNDVLVWSDDDCDGMIYVENLEPGNYMVIINPVDVYTFPTEPTKVVVKDKITYTAINILDEVKSEDEINASKEDGDGKGEIDEEAKLEDTVEWVESTRTIVSGADGYAAVDKSTIPDPATLSSGTVGAMAYPGNGLTEIMATTDMGTVSIALQVGEATQLVPAVQEDVNYFIPYTYSWATEGDAVKTTVSADSKSMSVEGLTAGSATVTCTVKKELADGSGTDEDVYKYAITVTEKAVAGQNVTELTLSAESLALQVGQEAEVKAEVKGVGDFNKDVKVTVSDDKVVKYEGGKVTALAAGQADITFTTVGVTTENKTLSKTCKVTVTEAEKGDLTLTVSEKKKTILVAEEYQINAVVKNYEKDKGVTYVSSDEKIATVDKNGLVKGVAKGGPIKITITTNEKGKDNKKLVETVEITVKANPKVDKKTPLKDASGNQIYIKGSDGKYVAAVWADYYTATAFYIETEPVYLYTGWQTLNGKTYFFDKNGKKVTGQQVILGVRYNFGSDGALSMNGGVLGIDVSKYQTTIDWTAVKNSGISFVIIRCGYRGYSTGVLVQDPMFETHIKGATAAGLKVGIYFFSQAINEKEAVEEASMAVALARRYTITYPIFIDTEQVGGGRADNLDATTRTAVCKAFCETVKSAGYTPGIYASKSWYESKLAVNNLSAYHIWLAQYASAPTYTGKYDMWQYTDKGKVKGVTGNVDMNLSYLGY